ncbi:MAG: hypothetical protein AB8H47_14200 [Bacteroidia bacterium]
MDVKQHRRINLILLSLLLACCVFFTFFDILYIKIWWTIPVIYLPCTLIFAGGINAWYKLNINQLYINGIILLLVSMLLLGYGVYLSLQKEFLWGPLTLGFAGLLLAMSWSSFNARLLIKQ